MTIWPLAEGCQAAHYAEDGLVTCHPCCATVRAPGGSAGVRKGREGDGAVGEGGGYVITHHSALRGIRQPGQGHRPGNVGG